MTVAVAGWLLGGVPSGADRRLLGILRNLPELLGDGEEVLVLHRSRAATPELPAGLGRRPVDIPACPILRRAVAERRILAPLLRQLGATVFEQGFLPVAPRLPCPVSLTLHDLRDLRGWRRRPARLARWVVQQGLARAGRITVPSRFTAGELREAFAGSLPPVDVIHGGVDSAGSAGRAAEEGREPGPPYFLHVGHLERRKNLELLLLAYADLAGACAPPPPALRLVGADHGMLPRLRRSAARLRVDGSVVFEGVVSERRLQRLYRGAVAVLVPSLYEGFGLPALEGLAAGRPVVVSDRGALPEVVGPLGTVVPGQDRSAWARALGCLWAARSGGAETAGDAAARRERAADFTWRRAAELTLAGWRQLHRSAGGQPPTRRETA